MAREFNAVFDFMELKEIDMRTAAYVHALGRIDEALTAHGTKEYFTNEG